MFFAWGPFRLRIKERKTRVLTGELIGVMYPIVTVLAEGGLIRSAEHRCRLFPTYITLDLHSFYMPIYCSEKFGSTLVELNEGRDITFMGIWVGRNPQLRWIKSFFNLLKLERIDPCKLALIDRYMKTTVFIDF